MRELTKKLQRRMQIFDQLGTMEQFLMDWTNFQQIFFWMIRVSKSLRNYNSVASFF